MPRTHPPEFRQRAVELARLREKPIAKIADNLGIAESCLRNWMKQADIDERRRHGLSTDVNRPGFPGGSKPWKGWSHGSQEEHLQAVSA